MPGEGASAVSPRSLEKVSSALYIAYIIALEQSRHAATYLSESFMRVLPADAACVFLRFGVGILHSIEKATQLVHGTPRLAASQRT